MTRPPGVDRNARPTKRERRQLDRLKGRDRDLKPLKVLLQDSF